jgi:hypothetical protein
MTDISSILAIQDDSPYQPTTNFELFLSLLVVPRTILTFSIMEPCNKILIGTTSKLTCNVKSKISSKMAVSKLFLKPM